MTVSLPGASLFFFLFDFSDHRDPSIDFFCQHWLPSLVKPNKLWTRPDSGAIKAKPHGHHPVSCGSVWKERWGNLYSQRYSYDDDCFYTINSGLVPLLVGLCAQFLYFRFEIIGVCVHIFAILFRTRKFVKRKRNWSKMSSSRLLAYTHTHVYFVHMYKYMRAEI